MILLAALYIDPAGPYPQIEGIDCWDEARDARYYAGPWPVVAHPACGPWGSLKSQYAGGEGGAELALLAVEQVRLWGGVLEHPRSSGLWAAANLPLPGEPADAWGGYTVAVNQSDWGHPCRKPTRLYCVRVPAEAHAVRPTFEGAKPTHWIGGAVHTGGRGQLPPGIKVATKKQRVLTPAEFAYHLCWLALQAR